MTKEQKIACNGIIHAASGSAAAVGGGLANLPGSDSPVLVTIQVGMIISLGGVFHQKITDSMAKSILAEFLGATVGKTVANALTGWLPGVGNAINATTAAAITEFIGWEAAKEFDIEDN